MDWWVTTGDRVPIGPVSTELLLQGIGAGKVPADALICEVGGTAWKRLAQTAPFSAAVRAPRRFDPESETTIAGRPPLPSEEIPLLGAFDDLPEHTLVDQSPLRPSEPPPRGRMESEEMTLVDVRPVRTSEPPTGP